MAEVVDYSLKHQFLGSLQGSGGEHQLSDEQVEDDSKISIVDRNVIETITFAMRQATKKSNLAGEQLLERWFSSWSAGPLWQWLWQTSWRSGRCEFQPKYLQIRLDVWYIQICNHIVVVRFEVEHTLDIICCMSSTAIRQEVLTRLVLSVMSVLKISWKYRLCWFYEFTVSLRHLLGVDALPWPLETWAWTSRSRFSSPHCRARKSTSGSGTAGQWNQMIVVVTSLIVV